MPYAAAPGAKLYYEETGSGFPIVFVHEFAGDHRSWEPQVRAFSRRYRCITYNARGYPPSDVPEDAADYGQAIAADDILAVMEAAGVDKAHVVGLSMGGFATLHFGLRHAARAASLVVAGCGYGAPREQRQQFYDEAFATAQRLLDEGQEAVGQIYAAGPTRVQFENKDPRGYDEFVRQLCEHDALGSANTLRGVQAVRPSLYDLEEELRDLTVPTLVMTGDEDEPCLDANLYLKRTIPSAGLVVMPRAGHTINLEDPADFNRALENFFAAVEQGRWSLRDPRSLSSKILSVEEDQT